VPVEFVNHDSVRMGEGTYMWVHLERFTFDVAHDDRAILAELIASDAYAWDFATSPAPPHPIWLEHRIHGKWPLDAINVDRFRPISPNDAVAVIDKWAREQEWSDSDYRQPEDALLRLEPVYELLRSGSVFQLDNPAEEEVEGFWVGSMGFHEFVVLDRSSGSLHVVVASDD